MAVVPLTIFYGDRAAALYTLPSPTEEAETTKQPVAS